MATPAPFASVFDPDSCHALGTVAFTDGGVTHFASRSPDVHVAAHEAAHQLQHAGVAHEAGLGAEGHANAVADSVVAKRPANGLVGTRGDRVPPACRTYTLADRDGNWKGVSAGAVFTRLADTGETWTKSGREAYATPALISQANNVLKGIKSGVSLSSGGGGKSVEPPDGSGPKGLDLIKVDIEGSPNDKTMPGDCRQAAKEVMGLQGPDTREEAKVTAGGVQTTVQPSKGPLDTIAMTIFVEQRTRDTPNYASMTGEEKRRVVDKAKEDFEKLDPDEKAKLKKSPVVEETAKRMGIDINAESGVGEGVAIYRADKAPMGQFDFHYATVIMVAGSDRITLENSGGDKGARDQKWKIETYGPASKNQSFHEEWAKTGRGTPGPAGTAQATTLVPWPPLLCTKLICSMSGSPFSNSAFALPGRRHCGVAAMAAPARRAAAGSRGRPQAEREPERSGGSQRPLDAVKGRRHLHFRFRP